MSKQGFVKLYRQIQDHWLYQEKRTFSKYEAWLDLLMMVNHKESKVLIDNELLTVKRGQCITSIRKLCDRWGWSNTKVKNFLELLKNDGMIIYKSDRRKTAIAIVNYDFYHDDDSEKHHGNDSPKRHENDSQISETHKKNDTETTAPTLDTQDFSGGGDSEKHHRNDTETHKQECKEVYKEEDRDPVIQFLIDNKIVHEVGITPTLQSDIVDVQENFGFDNPDEMMIEAIKESVRGNGRTWRFVYNKLLGWSTQGIKNKQQLMEIQQRQINKTIPFKPRTKPRRESSAILDKYREV